MIWLTWRQQRTETLLAALLLLLLAAVLVPTGLHMHAVYGDQGLHACLTKQTDSCAQAIGAFQDRFEHLGGIFGWFEFVPGLIGLLLAAPFVLDLEHGTYRLVWTQSITRGRWLRVKFALIVSGAILAALAMTLLFTWWRGPLDQINGRMNGGVFDFEGIVPYGYTLFALGLGLAIGAIVRRAVPALLLGLVGFVALRVFVQMWLRQRFEHPLSAVWAMGQPGPNLRTAWVLTQHPSDKLGHAVAIGPATFGRCAPPGPGGLAHRTAEGCLARIGLYQHAVYQPAGRFWLFQGIELAIFGGLALALVAFAGWWTYTRTS
jgi:hypothetical protein